MFKRIVLSNTFFCLVIFLEVIILISFATSGVLFRTFSGNERKSNVPKEYTLDTASSSTAITRGSTNLSPFPTGGVENISNTKTSNKSSSSTSPNVAGLPSRIVIPKLGINTSVEYVGLDSEGGMDVPKSFTTVAWYKLGYRIGDNGSAVMSGHYDTHTGAPAVFWNISKLSSGDVITVLDTSGASYTFTVKDKKVYDFDKFPLQEVFGKGGSPGLNLITCSGEWNKISKNYSTRTVIYAFKN